MTDIAAPITEPHLAPMFATGGQPALAPNTEPHPSPIFDTGPHPEPLRATESDAVSDALNPQSMEWDSDEWAAISAAAAGSEAGPEPAAALDYERAPVWDAGSPESEPELARIARGLDAAVVVELEPSVPHQPARAFVRELER